MKLTLFHLRMNETFHVIKNPPFNSIIMIDNYQND